MYSENDDSSFVPFTEQLHRSPMYAISPQHIFHAFFGSSILLYLVFFPFIHLVSLKMVAVDERSCALSVDLDTSRSLGLLSYVHFTSAGLYLCRTSVTDTVTMATVSKDH